MIVDYSALFVDFLPFALKRQSNPCSKHFNGKSRDSALDGNVSHGHLIDFERAFGHKSKQFGSKQTKKWSFLVRFLACFLTVSLYIRRFNTTSHTTIY